MPIPDKQAVLDHNHSTQFVRAVLHRQSNATLGKIENLYTRYLSYWYPYSLSTFLRQVANYIDKPDDKRYIHPAWLKRVKTDFNKLKTKEQNDMLTLLGIEELPSNLKGRKDLFNQVLLTRVFTFDTIQEFLILVKE